jgi:hypothetical protein
MAKPISETKSVVGTSYHGINIETTASKLNKKYGKSEVSGDGKTQREWNLETNDGEPFTVYDYKEGRKIKLSEVYQYHIGAMDEQTAAKVRRELKSDLK